MLNRLPLLVFAAVATACGGAADEAGDASMGSICDGSWSFAASLVTASVPCAPRACEVLADAFTCATDARDSVVPAPYEPVEEGGGRVCTTFASKFCSPCVPSGCVVLTGGVICTQDCSGEGRTCYELSLEEETFDAACGS